MKNETHEIDELILEFDATRMFFAEEEEEEEEEEEARVVVSLKDVTARKQAEAEIASLAKFPDENPNPIVRVGGDGRVLYANTAAGGLLQSLDSAVGRPAPARWRDWVAQALDSHAGQTMELEHAGRVYACDVIPIQGSGYANVYARDITARKRAEEALREQNALRDGMLESLDFPFFAVDTAYRYLAFNQSHAAVMKAVFDRDIEIGKSLLEYHTVLADREKAKTYLDQALKGEIIVVHEYAGDDQLSRRYFEILHCPIRDANDRIIGVAILARDITDRKRAEEALRASEEYYRTIIQTAMDGFWVADLQGRLLQVNAAYCRMSGYPEQELLTMSIPDLEARETPTDTAAHIKTVIAQGKDRFESTHRRKDGSLFQVDASIQYRPSEGGQFVVFLHDITERKRAEEALKTSEQDLQDLIYIASHDLQTPIVSMQGYISNLIKASASRLDEKGNYALQRLQANAERLHRLVLSLLDLSRVSTVKNPYKTFDPGVVVQTILDELDILVKQTGANVVIEPMPALRGDEPRLTSVFRNLLTNAVHYGGKQIVVGYRKGAYFVQDDGIGIAPHNLAKIFRPGERLKKIEVDGVGMGLTFCQKVILQHQGRIWTESAGEGTGTTVYFTIGA